MPSHFCERADLFFCGCAWRPCRTFCRTGVNKDNRNIDKGVLVYGWLRRLLSGGSADSPGGYRIHAKSFFEWLDGKEVIQTLKGDEVLGMDNVSAM